MSYSNAGAGSMTISYQGEMLYTKEQSFIKENNKAVKVQNNSSEAFMKYQKIVTLGQPKTTE